MEQVINAIGFQSLWGSSASFDWLEAMNTSSTLNGAATTDSPINILLVNPGDIRHIINTIAYRRRHGDLRPIHFYLLETMSETIARDIFFLEMLTDFEIPIRQRATVFLEIFGNSKVQTRTARYIEQIAYRLKTMTSNTSVNNFDLVDLSLLKYREKDKLESIFASYNQHTKFDMDHLRDQRIRGHCQERYDSRRALTDWDHSYSIKGSASIIHIRLYRDWREKGIAFEFGDQTYDVTNWTMMSYMEGKLKHGKEKGELKEVLGYWGDIVCSPYLAFGTDCDTPNSFAEGLFEIINRDTGTEQHRHHTVEIALYNLISYLWELETGKVYRMTKANDLYSGLGVEAGSIAVEKTKSQALDAILEGEDGENEGGDKVPEKASGSDSPPVQGPQLETVEAAAIRPDSQRLQEEEDLLVRELRRAESIVESLSNVKVFPMIGNPVEVLGKARFAGMFDGMFISNRTTNFATNEIASRILRQDRAALIALESSKYIIPLVRDQKSAFNEKIREAAIGSGWESVPGPVRRRNRETSDKEFDVLFFQKK